jgi:hypothetical protein
MVSNQFSDIPYKNYLIFLTNLKMDNHTSKTAEAKSIRTWGQRFFRPMPLR